MANKEVSVLGINVNYKYIGKEDYISITDIAKYFNAQDPSGVIRNWMSNKDSFEFYSLWEEINNPNFNSVQMRRIKTEEVGYNRFTMTPKRWKDEFNAIGIYRAQANIVRELSRIGISLLNLQVGLARNSSYI